MIRRALLLGLVAVLVSARVSYEGFQVWRLEVSQEQKAPVRQILEKHNLDVWGQGKDWIDVMIDPKLRHGVMSSLAAEAIHSSVMIENVQKLIDRDYQNIAREPREVVFDDYNSFEEIEAYLAGLAETDDRVSLRTIGQSFEGRELWQLIISVGPGKKIFWMDCGIHAREWIAPAVCLYGIDFLLNNYGTDTDATAFLDAYDVYFLPVNNPDGYSYTWTDDRLWRKNRQTYAENACVGVDLNRNFDVDFGGLGTSDISCAETYGGPSAASELETQAVQAAIVELSPDILFTMHSYSQIWMYPYSYTFDLPPDVDELDRVSAIGVEALNAVYGTEYVYGNVADIIYPAAGCTLDYSYISGVTYSMELELRDTGENGFVLPPEEITPTCEETWAGVFAAVAAVPY